MKYVLLLTILSTFSISAFAQDILGGKCRTQAQSARDAIASINKTKSSDEPTTLLLDTGANPNSPVETYYNGPYTVKANKGSDDYSDCAIMSVEFNPAP